MTEVTSRLKATLENILEFIDYIPENEQVELLGFLDEWKHPQRRKQSRKGCFLPVDFSVDGRFFSGSIQDISPEGVAVACPGSFEVGKKIVLSFVVPGLPKPVKAGGQIVWAAKDRFGARIEMSTKYLREYLEKAIKDL